MKQIYWVIEGVLAGRCGPAHTAWELGELRQAGIGGIVSLDETSVNPDDMRAAAIEHLPIYLPMVLLLEPADRHNFLQFLPPIFEFIDRHREQKSGVLVHCYYGCDRTGAVLGCYLIARQGLSSADAIDRIRQLQPGALQAPGYSDLVALFEDEQANLSHRSPRRRPTAEHRKRHT